MHTEETHFSEICCLHLVTIHSKQTYKFNEASYNSTPACHSNTGGCRFLEGREAHHSQFIFPEASWESPVKSLGKIVFSFLGLAVLRIDGLSDPLGPLRGP